MGQKCGKFNLLFKNAKKFQKILKITTNKKSFGLNTMDNIDMFQKLISTDRETWILIGLLDCLEPQAYIYFYL